MVRTSPVATRPNYVRPWDLGVLYAGVLFLFISKAATAITLATMTNTIVTLLLAGWFGGKPLTKYVAPGMIAILATGSLILMVFGFTHL